MDIPERVDHRAHFRATGTQKSLPQEKKRKGLGPATKGNSVRRGKLDKSACQSVASFKAREANSTGRKKNTEKRKSHRSRQKKTGENRACKKSGVQSIQGRREKSSSAGESRKRTEFKKKQKNRKGDLRSGRKKLATP